MKQTKARVGLITTALAFILGMSGCPRPVAPVEGKDSLTQTEANEKAGENSSQMKTSEPVLTPAQMGFPPEQPPPWEIAVSAEPLSPSQTANTGDFRGPWPKFSPPRELQITFPELPPGVADPTLESVSSSTQGNPK
ncbi:MAG: hypothetical protein ACUVTH_01485 [Thermogutta sp.]